MYVWMTYIVPHFRYGSLMFYPEINNGGKKTEYSIAFIKLYNKIIKSRWKLPRNANEMLIKTALGQWNAEVIYTGNYVTNANKWMKTY